VYLNHTLFVHVRALQYYNGAQLVKTYTKF